MQRWKRSLLILSCLVVTLLCSLTISLGQSNRRPKITAVESATGIFRLEQSFGSSRYKRLSDYIPSMQKTQSLDAIDSTVIDLRFLSDSAFSSMCTFSQEVPISDGSFRPPLAGDLNQNGKPELYGYQKVYAVPEQWIHGLVYEADTTGIFRLAYSYPDSIIDPLAIYDIFGDGRSAIVQHVANNQDFVFRPSGQGGLPTNLCFDFNPYARTSQMNHPTFGDFDGNGKTDVVFGLMAPNQTFISEYNQQTNSIDTVYSFAQPDVFADGFSVGDYDQDGKTDIVEGSVNGYVYLIKTLGVHQYRNVWTGTVQTYNAYLHMGSHDIDGNGKPEFWVGGDAYYNGVGMTRFTCFETAGNNMYVPVHRIDLVGVFSFYAGNCFAEDIDGDGKEELFICIDQTVIILKFVGQPNHHAYKIYYLKHNELADQNSVYYGATLYDLTGKGTPQMLITMDQVNASQERREFTRIYTSNIVTGIHQKPELQVDEYQLFQNYPNPFNPTTTIRYGLPQRAYVTLTVFNTLGQAVATLVQEEQNAGYHDVRFYGSGLASGVYFYRLQAGDFVQAKKFVILR